MKKFALTLIALVLVLGCALGLAACDDGKINVSIAQFDDDGIRSIALFAVKRNEVEGGVESDSSLEKFSNRGELYASYFEEDVSVKLDKGEYIAGVAIQLENSHYMNEGLSNGTGSDLKIKVDGIESNFISTEYLGTFTAYDYFAFVGLDVLFNEDVSEDDEMYTITKDTTIELIGSTTIKTYSPTFEIWNYDENSDVYGDLVFKILYRLNGSSLDGELLTNDAGSNEFTVKELETFFKEKAEYTYFTVYEVVGYFKNEKEFSREKLSDLINLQGRGVDNSRNAAYLNGDNDELEFEFMFLYASDRHDTVILDFSVFDDLA